MSKSLNNNFNWPLRDDICWVPVSHILCLLFDYITLQSAGTDGYCLSNSEFPWLFDDVIKSYDHFLEQPTTMTSILINQL